MNVVALVPNLMDRGRFASVPGITFVSSADALPAAVAAANADACIVDLTAAGAVDVLPRLSGRPTYAFAGHVAEDLLAAAAAVPNVEALPRSIFFRRLPGLFA